MSDEQRKIEINWVQASAGALAAMSSAVLLSTVGVAGTIIGAALGSVLVTIGAEVYSATLHASRSRVGAVASTRMRVRRARAHVHQAATEPETPRAEERLDEAQRELDQAEHGLDVAEETAAEPVHWREALATLPWRKILPVAAVVFVAAMVVIVTFELLTGRAVSSYTGGSDANGPRTSIPGLGGGGKQEPAPASDTTPTPTSSPSGPTRPGDEDGGDRSVPPTEPTVAGTSTTAPTRAPTRTATATATATPTPTPTAAPTPTPTPTKTTAVPSEPAPTSAAPSD